ncbi:MAG: signal recognition particle-docking protein FtsY [Nitrospinae bacterium]|nr:signal recognition particle-docking protein FtsY [Nitrospinota bacterium]
MSWIERLKEGLNKTRKGVQRSLLQLVGQGHDPAVLEEVEASLLGADVGVRAVDRLMERLRDEVGGDSIQTLKDTLVEILAPAQSDSIETVIRSGPKPFVILGVGVNGVGKTTSMAKLASRLKRQGLKPLLVAADTFRAGAIEQLEIWGNRIGVDVIKHRQGADPSAVVFDGLAAAKARGIDVVLIDTAGRLHTKVNLMDELKKMKRILDRELPGAPHEVLLTLDGTIGQNSLAQVKQFHEAIGVTGLALAKLDGTSKGGVVVAIAQEFAIPVRLIGVGEQEEDLQDFHAREFADALLEVQE